MLSTDRPILKRWLWGLAALFLFFYLAWHLGKVAILIMLSFLVAYVLNPLVTRLAQIRFVGRTAATLMTLAGLTVGFIAVLFFILPQVAVESKSFIDKLPALADKLERMVGPFLEQNFQFHIPKTWNDAGEQIYQQIQKDGKKWVAPAAYITKMIFGTASTAIYVLVSMLMFPLFLFFLLKDFPDIISTIDGLVPVRHQRTVRRLAKEVDRSLSAFLHGQFTVMLVLGTLYSVGYSIVGIPLALGVGMLTGLLCFIPYLGAATGFIIALLMAIFSFSGWQPILGVALVFTSVQATDAAVITPRILGGKLGLQPLWIIVALMAGGELFGFLGVLLAVPTMAVLKVLVMFSMDVYKHSYLYTTGDFEVLTGVEEGIGDVDSRDAAVEAPTPDGREDASEDNTTTQIQ
ncbi:MAG: AI-2E family transporter [Deltaproteobacteria bacterium]|nr:AI-2E family transporter [Deltaproteobacteria bacterium]MBN2671955.1 AI-2E family transporter [Deltaproteobacteria bacterium]